MRNSILLSQMLSGALISLIFGHLKDLYILPVIYEFEFEKNHFLDVERDVEGISCGEMH